MEDDYQLYKKHHSKSEKTKAKIHLKKNAKQRKKLKEKYKKLKKHENPQTIDEIKDLIIMKLHKRNESALSDLETLFQLLNDGKTLNLTQLEDDYTKSKLKKLFKLLPITRESSYVFIPSTDKKIKNQLKEETENLIKRAKSSIYKLKRKEENIKESNSENNEEIKEGPIQEQQDNEIPQLDTQKLIGPQLLPQAKYEENFLKSTLNCIQKVSGSKDEIDDLNKNDPEEVGPQPEFIFSSEQKGMNFELKKEIQFEYNKMFRPKTLMEMHKEKLKDQAKFKGIKTYRPFDREKDLKISRIDKLGLQKLQKNETLTSKFGNNHFLS